MDELRRADDRARAIIMQRVTAILTSLYTLIGILVLVLGMVAAAATRISQTDDRLKALEEAHVRQERQLDAVFDIDKRLSRIEGALGIKITK